MIGFQPGTVESYYIDRGISIWANRIEAEMDKASARAKSKIMATAARNRVLSSYIRPGTTQGLYRDPAALVKKQKDGVQDGMVIGGDNRG